MGEGEYAFLILSGLDPLCLDAGGSVLLAEIAELSVCFLRLLPVKALYGTAW